MRGGRCDGTPRTHPRLLRTRLTERPGIAPTTAAASLELGCVAADVHEDLEVGVVHLATTDGGEKSASVGRFAVDAADSTPTSPPHPAGERPRRSRACRRSTRNDSGRSDGSRRRRDPGCCLKMRANSALASSLARGARTGAPAPDERMRRSTVAICGTARTDVHEHLDVGGGRELPRRHRWRPRRRRRRRIRR